MEPKERRMYTLMQQVRTIGKDKEKKRRQKNRERAQKRQKILDREALKFADQAREAKKVKYIKMGRDRQKRLSTMN